jgi:glyoxylase-like metal-dependent hydrolase (beta-lactamase superfamily II)
MTTEQWETPAFVETRRVGGATVTVVSDGTFLWAPELRAPEAEWRRAIPEANDRGEIWLGHHMVLIRHEGAVILVDAGFDDPSPTSSWMPPRARRSPGVQAGLARIGVSPEQVTHVFLTHAHGDHIAGATVERDGQRLPRYPRARYLLGRRDWEGNPALEQPASLIALHLGALRRAGVLALQEGEREVVPGVTLIPSPGDSPGHYLLRLRSGGETFYAVGDLFHHACEVDHTGWASPGRDREAARVSREALNAAAAPAGATVVFTHEPFPPWGRIVAAGPGGHRWQRDATPRRPPAGG